MKRLDIICHLGSDAVAEKKGDLYQPRFSVGVSEKYLDKNNVEVTNTDWVTVFLTRKNANKLTPYLKKGMKVFVTGKPTFSVNEYQGEYNPQTTINANKIEFMAKAD